MSEVVRAGLRLLEEHETKLKALRETLIDRAMFSFGGTLSSLKSSDVSNLEAAKLNARAFAAETIAILRKIAEPAVQVPDGGQGESLRGLRLRCRRFRPVKPLSAASPEAVRAVAERSDFSSSEPEKKRPRREARVYRTGRNAHFSCKADPDVVDEIYAIADAQGWVIGETLEHAVAALKLELSPAAASFQRSAAPAGKAQDAPST